MQPTREAGPTVATAFHDAEYGSFVVEHGDRVRCMRPVIPLAGQSATPRRETPRRPRGVLPRRREGWGRFSRCRSR
jgi:hypothetical protein